MRLAFCTTLIAMLLTGCATAPVDREGKLLTMAAAEAQQIADSKERLTRQLNFAAQQRNSGKFAESRQSLAYAAQTLRDAKPDDLKPQIRIAGWVSISELSRAADDRATAVMACDQAVNVLKSLEPIADRPQYVVGVSEEVKALHGDLAAGKFLETSADWVKQIEGHYNQREAIVAIARATIECNDFDGGLALLRTDSDAAWRSDTLAMMAQEAGSRFQPISMTQSGVAANTTFIDANGNTVPNPTAGSRSSDWISNVGNAAVPGSIAANPTSPTQVGESAQLYRGTTQPFISKPVDFQSVFQRGR